MPPFTVLCLSAMRAAAVGFVFRFAFLALACAQLQTSPPLQRSPGVVHIPLTIHRHWPIEDNEHSAGHPSSSHQLPTHRQARYHFQSQPSVAAADDALLQSSDALSGHTFIDEPSAIHADFESQQIFPSLYSLEAAVEYLNSMPEFVTEPADVSFTYTRSIPRASQTGQQLSPPIHTNPLSYSNAQSDYATHAFTPQPVRPPSFSPSLIPTTESVQEPSPALAPRKDLADEQIQHPTPLVTESPTNPPAPSPSGSASPTLVLKLHPVLHLPSNENHVHITVNQTEFEGHHINIIHPHSATKKQQSTTPAPLPPVTEIPTTPTPASTAAPESTAPPTTTLPPATPTQPQPETPAPTVPPSTPPANVPPSQETTTPLPSATTQALPHSKQPRLTTQEPPASLPATPPITRLPTQPVQTKKLQW